ncbi:TIGR00341 family protein [Paraurantiacibacter namhicola]|uniref:TIGR00341 family protein n=1 Tax=Paraurantiacibacter namhicola TaxID=645517 RepID=A0A1C7D727_9SPHN|nr:TIGR00341 family protein [Paraurantiacibacter namhicola]ANU07103.1 hypothetical protein A6F65_00784 [Paraurantiacibacter namhicola]
MATQQAPAASPESQAGLSATTTSTKRSFSDVVLHFREYWHETVVGTVDQQAVIEKRRAECTLSARYLLMTAMSAGIAILGLLLSSPAVVIGAMLLSPLMDPIMGLGFSFATGDFKWLRQSAKSLAIGTVMAIAFCAFVVWVSPLQTITEEIASRTRPNLFDLAVALFSAIAGAYAMIRGRDGTIVGVAIATALMPPLAVVGFGFATWNATVFWGSLLLFFTNLMTIALTATVMARLYGFRTNLSNKQTLAQTLLIVAAFVSLAIPLGLSLISIAGESAASRQVSNAIAEQFDENTRIQQVDVSFASEPLLVTATVLTPQLQPDAERRAAAIIAKRLARPVDLKLTQVEVGSSASAAEEAQLSAARENEAKALEQETNLSRRLALVAGVSDGEVLVDRGRQRAVVTARPLPGANLATYRELEARAAQDFDGWTIQVRPPAGPLPTIEFQDEVPDAEALGLVRWAGVRVGAPIAISGPADAVAALAETLGGDGIAVIATPRGSGYGPVTMRWAAPDATGDQ